MVTFPHQECASAQSTYSEESQRRFKNSGGIPTVIEFMKSTDANVKAMAYRALASACQYHGKLSLPLPKYLSFSFPSRRCSEGWWKSSADRFGIAAERYGQGAEASRRSSASDSLAEL